MLELRIALRFLLKSKLQSLLIVLGIGVGIAVQVFVGSLITSLQQNLLDQTVGSSPHITLESKDEGGTFAFTAALRDTVESDPSVTAVVPQRLVTALVTPAGAATGAGGAAATPSPSPLVVKTGALADLDQIYQLEDSLMDGGRLPQGSGIVVGKEFAEANGLAVGQDLDLLLGSGERVQSRLDGVVDLGVQAANERLAFGAPELGAEAFPGEPAATVDLVETQVSDVFASSTIAADWQEQLPELQVVDWQQTNESLLTALQSQSTSSYMIQVFVIVAVMLGIASTLAISAVQKTRQIGILKALGMGDARTGLVFLLQAGILGVLGTLLGIAIGVGLIAGFTLRTRGLGVRLPHHRRNRSSSRSPPRWASASRSCRRILPYRRTARLDPIEVIQSG